MTTLNLPRSWWNNISENNDVYLLPDGRHLQKNRLLRYLSVQKSCYICGTQPTSLTIERNKYGYYIKEIKAQNGYIFSLDHHYPKILGGQGADNYKACCQKCNNFKGASTVEPVLCWGWIKLAASRDCLHEYASTSCMNPVVPISRMRETIKRIGKSECMLPHMGFLKIRPQTDPS
jgi:hypothetical protein